MLDDVSRYYALGKVSGSAVIGHLSLLLGENAVQCAVVCQQSEGRHTMQHCIQFQSVLYSLMADDSI